jgi:hypothetical protein
MERIVRMKGFVRIGENASGLGPQHAQSRGVLGTPQLAPETACDLSYKRGKIPRAARDFYGWRIRAGGRERALGYKESRRVRYEHAKNKERSFGAQNAPQDGSGKRLESSRAEDRLSRVSAYLWFRHSQQARATSVGTLFEDVSGRSAHALAERQLAQTCEFVGAISKREGWEFRATHRKRRGASRRST